MASDPNYVTYICEQLSRAGEIGCKKMFGEYMVYVDKKPAVLVCDDTAYVKILPETTAILTDSNPIGCPYQGAKPHYILDIDDGEKAVEVCAALAKVLPLPKKR